MNLSKLRVQAVGGSLFPRTSLEEAMDRLGFVQADPIRAPARAQDLILRQRVDGYRAGDLERRYPDLAVDEGYLYAYGFVAPRIGALLHPRQKRALTKREQEVLATVRRTGAVHPRHLEEEFGRKRVVNAWGGYSKETTRALERLHHLGFARVARREGGIRVYEAAPEVEARPAAERIRGLIVAVAHVLAPVLQPTLHSLVGRLRRSIAPKLDHRKHTQDLLKRGELEASVVDGLTYLWPAGWLRADEPGDGVRFLAPFDPVVWDRRRFEHLWSWEYRFEAYTPAAKRVRGYYAMPLLWRDSVIGWANARVSRAGLDVELGFVGDRPADPEFVRGLDEEVAALEDFLT